MRWERSTVKSQKAFQAAELDGVFQRMPRVQGGTAGAAAPD